MLCYVVCNNCLGIFSTHDIVIQHTQNSFEQHCQGCWRALLSIYVLVFLFCSLFKKNHYWFFSSILLFFSFQTGGAVHKIRITFSMNNSRDRESLGNKNSKLNVGIIENLLYVRKKYCLGCYVGSNAWKTIGVRIW